MKSLSHLLSFLILFVACSTVSAFTSISLPMRNKFALTVTSKNDMLDAPSQAGPAKSGAKPAKPMGRKAKRKAKAAKAAAIADAINGKPPKKTN